LSAKESTPRDGQTWDRHWGVQVLLVLVGLGLLVLGAHWLVEAAVTVARELGMSELVVGLTIVAAIRGERDIAVGNIVGSNISISSPCWVSPSVLHRTTLLWRLRCWPSIYR